VSLNLHRRHLDESQRAIVAAKIADMKRGDNQHASIDATSHQEAADLLNTSRRKRPGEIPAPLTARHPGHELIHYAGGLQSRVFGTSLR